ncbi:MAG: GNAT family N-acetyltransferase [Chloroflexota bacterium]
MDPASAEAILHWQYPHPYSFYNLALENEDDTLQEMLDGSQYAVRDTAGSLVGFFAFGPTAQVPGGHRAGAYRDDRYLDIGLGMSPDLTSQGKGTEFVQAGIDFAATTLNAPALRLSVATFNQRAIRVYERTGFLPGIRFHSLLLSGEAEFLLMTRG